MLANNSLQLSCVQSNWRTAAALNAILMDCVKRPGNDSGHRTALRNCPKIIIIIIIVFESDETGSG